MLGSASQYPIYGPEIQCPHCRQPIPALLLTDSYLCTRHGAFEANPETQELVHVQSGRHWRRWEDQWHRQHTHPDGVRFEIHEELDRLYTKGLRATRVVISSRYKDLMLPYLEHGAPNKAEEEEKVPKLYGLPVCFSEGAASEGAGSEGAASEGAAGASSERSPGDSSDSVSDGMPDSRWDVINFDLETEPGVPNQYRYLKIFE